MTVQDTIRSTRAPPRDSRAGGRFAGVAIDRGALVVAAATVTMALGFGGLGLITVFMKPMEADLGWSRADLSLAYGLSTTGMALGGLFWGRLCDRLDVRLLLILGAIGMAGPLLLMSTVRSLPMFYVAHLLYGACGFSTLYAPLLSTSGEWYPQRRGLVMGIVTAGGAAGQGLLPLFASFLIAALGWRFAFTAVGCTFIVALALVLPLLRWPQGTRAPSVNLTDVRDTATAETLTVALLACAAFLCCACMGVPVVHLANFVGGICASPRAGVASLVIAMIFGAAGRVCCGVIADRIGALRAYALASAIQTACVFMFPLLENSVPLLMLSAVFGFGFAGNMTCLSLCVRQAVLPKRFGTALGAVMMIAWAGMAAGGYIGGLLFDFSGSYTASFDLAALAGIMNLAVISAIGATRNLRPISAA
jgi:MFS family permease